MGKDVDAGSVVGRLELNIKGWEKAVEKVKQDQQSLSGMVLRHSQAFKDFGKTLTVTGTAMVASISAIALKTADAGEEVLNLSKKYGVSTEILSGYKLGLEKSGASLDAFGVGMKGLANTMQAANSGNKTAAGLFDTLGIKVNKTDGSLRNMSDVMLDVADYFAGMKDGASKAALAQDLLGKSGADLIPWLNMGRKGIEENAEASRKLGLVWSQEAAVAAAEFNDNLAELKGGLQGLGIQIGTALMPPVQGAVNSLKGLVAMLKGAADAHPFLIQAVGSLGIAFGTMGMTVGPLVLALPKLVQGFQYLKAMLATTALGVNAFMGVFTASLAAVILYISKLGELAAAEDRLQASTKSLYETENNLVDKLSAAASAADWQFGRMSKLIQAYDFNYAALVRDIKEGKLGVDIQKAFAEVCEKHAAAVDKLQAATGGLTTVQQALNEKLGLTLRVDLEKKYRDMLTALTAYKGKLTEPAEKKLMDDLIALRAELDGTKPSIDTLDETLQRFFDGIAQGMSDADLQSIGDDFSNMAQQMQRDFDESLKGLVDDLQQFGPSAELFDLKLKTIGDALGYSAETVRLFLYELQRIPLAMAGVQLPDLWGMFVAKGEQAVEKTRSVMQEVSTVLSDAMRNIGRSIVDAFGISEALAYKPIDWEKTGVAAYFKRALEETQRDYDGRTEALRQFYEQAARAEDRAFSAAELKIKRREEDEDIRYERAYERDREAIEHSKMTEEQKSAALRKLELKYEDDKLKRERAREDARLARELAHAAKLAKIKEDEKRRELEMEKAFQLELDRIRKDEQIAKDFQAKQDEERQRGLWATIKGIIGTAAEEMLTVLATKLITPACDAIAGLVGKLIGKGKDSVGDAMDGVGGKVKGLGATIGEFISGIGVGIGGFISGLATGIGAAIVSLATAVATAATVLAAAAPAIIMVGAITLGLVAGIKLLDKIFASGKGAGAGDGMGRVVERQDIQISLITRIFEDLNLNLKPTLWAISSKSDTLIKHFDTAIDHLKKIGDGIGDLVKKIQPAASGWEGKVSHPTLFLAHPDEHVSITPPYIGGGLQMVPGGPSRASRGGIVINANFDIKAFDRAGVESFLRNEAKDILQRMLEEHELRPVADGIIG